MGVSSFAALGEGWLSHSGKLSSRPDPSANAKGPVERPALPFLTNKRGATPPPFLPTALPLIYTGSSFGNRPGGAPNSHPRYCSRRFPSSGRALGADSLSLQFARTPRLRSAAQLQLRPQRRQCRLSPPRSRRDSFHSRRR